MMPWYFTLSCAEQTNAKIHGALFQTWFVRLPLGLFWPARFPNVLSRDFAQASLNFQDPALQALIESLSEAPAAARLRRLEGCGLTDKNGVVSDNDDHDKDADEPKL